MVLRRIGWLGCEHMGGEVELTGEAKLRQFLCSRNRGSLEGREEREANITMHQL